MQVNRGCGCLLLVLAAINLVFLIAGIVGLVTGTAEIGLGMLGVVLFGANMVAALMLGLAGVRQQRIGVGEGTGVSVGEAGAASEEEVETPDDEGSE